MLILSEHEVQERYKMSNAIEDIENVFKTLNNDKIKLEQRTVIPTGEDSKSMLYMPAVNLEAQLGMIKITSITPNNPKHQLPTTQAKIVITDLEYGEHKAVIDGSYLTRLRTGALSGIATKYLSREDSHTLGMIGTGGMAFEQLLGILEVRNITTLLLYNRTTEKADAFKEKVQESFPNLDIQVVEDTDELLEHADIINCQTRSDVAVFNGEHVKPGTHINGIGSYQPEMREIDVKAIERASKVVFDDVDGVLEESGEMIEAMDQGVFNVSDLYASLNELSTKQLKRDNDEEITVFKCVGAAYYDLAVALGVYQNEA
ncbi:ornithine cyclodeaminase family protein [Staphylococcus massiliensis]|uniref:Putative ornithine cyclodeaminase n=1 Tax=Staphylococcus massiliensis S46 TaxID=1229783 RepID=K9AS15_9STAP|nr:ornithine cyclodeaminase [Staphylococcus massiliensis]EKU50228.1 putative ornithine cyclodeaminase [Staphylococcus massiliensis S46]MCG3400850.1 ornithine cyclodeaminase family protein [Staphylococcus massiliensis]MCG3411985.1 ornithine cyclodeaminase family protein [Staphylococcus massiliensis]PNZ99991.1 ornithine cyclodeaminase [Staphylococcus massiliensis CCUG 55927]